MWHEIALWFMQLGNVVQLITSLEFLATKHDDENYDKMKVMMIFNCITCGGHVLTLLSTFWRQGPVSLSNTTLTHAHFIVCLLTLTTAMWATVNSVPSNSYWIWVLIWSWIHSLGQIRWFSGNLRKEVNVSNTIFSV